MHPTEHIREKLDPRKDSRAYLAFVILLFIGFSACEHPTESESEGAPDWSRFEIVPSDSVFTVGDEKLTISYSYVNRSDQEIYVGRCVGGYTETLERLVDGQWVQAYNPVCAGPGGGSPIKIAADARFSAEFTIYASLFDPGSPFDMWPGDDITGTYRLRDDAYGEWTEEKYEKGQIESVTIYSKPFRISSAD